MFEVTLCPKSVFVRIHEIVRSHMWLMYNYYGSLKEFFNFLKIEIIYLNKKGLNFVHILLMIAILPKSQVTSDNFQERYLPLKYAMFWVN